MTSDLVIAALNMALHTRRPESVIHHAHLPKKRQHLFLKSVCVCLCHLRTHLIAFDLKLLLCNHSTSTYLKVVFLATQQRLVCLKVDVVVQLLCKRECIWLGGAFGRTSKYLASSVITHPPIL